MAVVLIMKMQYGFQIIPMMICNIFWGFENLDFMQSNFFAEIMAQLRHVGPRPEMGSNLG